MTPDTKRAEGKPRAKKKAPAKAAAPPPAPAQDASAIADDERRLARWAAFGIPVGSVVAALVVTAVTSAGPGLLVLAGGIILGAIALFWASLRTLTGDAPLAGDLEESTFSAPADPLAARKTMLLRALKDLDNEKAVGKIHEKDHAILGARYREEIKAIMRTMDADIAPHVKDAEALLAKHLVRVGLAGDPFRTNAKADQANDEALAADEALPPSARPVCAACKTVNDADAKFCKSCGATVEGPKVEASEVVDTRAAEAESAPANDETTDGARDEDRDEDEDEDEDEDAGDEGRDGDAPVSASPEGAPANDTEASGEEQETSKKSRVDHA